MASPHTVNDTDNDATVMIAADGSIARQDKNLRALDAWQVVYVGPILLEIYLEVSVGSVATAHAHATGEMLYELRGRLPWFLVELDTCRGWGSW